MQARVEVDRQVVGELPSGPGLVVLLGCGEGDTAADCEYMVTKIAGLRIFEDDAGKMNLSVVDVVGGVLVVSQFTLYGDCRKGRRPSFVKALEPESAERLVELFVDRIGRLVDHVATGSFGATMAVHLVNDGPVTLVIDSSKLL